MRPFFVFVFLLMAAVAAAEPSRTVTVVLDLRQDAPAGVLAGMKAEAARLLAASPYRPVWRVLGDSVQQEFPAQDLLVVRLHGVCRLSPLPELMGDERGPYAWTHVTDGNVLPFAEVSCDRVRKRVRGVLHGSDFERADTLMGRALARVIVHEMIHVLTGRCDHDADGVMRHALAPSELVADTLPVRRLLARP